MKGPVVAAVASFALALALVAWVTIQTEITGENPLGHTEPGERSRVYHLDRGDCFDAGPAYDERSDVTVLDCDEPHDSEVVWSDKFDAYVDLLPAGSDVELRAYLDGGISKMRDFGADEEKWTVACVAWSG
ncbi:hypothetical protein [Nocardioides zhouii]|uniref:Septum formation-related domain-containing protein n=1 Tax=Nocardioides zhouii TaxID=1168729 RepID=A0A4Q2SWY2_9ACTN|nr:hypothetical protein [Nocardioides zhouii]RYC10402.1 hypothetical protein EUA94_12790 [Nocardioides zhouii]